MHPEDAARLKQARRETLNSGASYECEYRIRTADGSYRWFRSSAGARRDETGAVMLWYGTTQDIHDRKLAELTHQGHTRVLEMIAAGRPLGEVLNALCRLAEDQIAGARCSILLFDPLRRLLRHGAAPNLPPAYNAAIDPSPSGRRRVMRHGRLYPQQRHRLGYRERSALGSMARSRPAAQPAGLLVEADSLAFRRGARHLRLLLCRAAFSDEGEMASIDAVSHLAALAIERQRSEAALRESEEHYRYSVELNPQIPWTADAEWQCL